MNALTMLHGAEPREVLQAVIEKKTPAILSFLSEGKWHVARVLLTNLGANKLDVRISPKKMDSASQKNRDVPAQTTTQQSHSINIQINQPVGVSLKYGYGKFIFETSVVAIEPSPDSASGEMISLLVPDRIEIVQRRSYFRVNVPGSLKVNVMLWHRRCIEGTPKEHQTVDVHRKPPECYWQGRLADISAGGVQVVVDSGQKPDFKKGQFVGLRFTPMPYEMPLMFSAQIRNVLPTADQKCICLGLQIIGLEASPEGRQVLQRLCNVAEHYYQINQCTLKVRDFQTTGSPH